MLYCSIHMTSLYLRCDTDRTLKTHRRKKLRGVQNMDRVHTIKSNRETANSGEYRYTLCMFINYKCIIRPHSRSYHPHCRTTFNTWFDHDFPWFNT